MAKSKEKRKAVLLRKKGLSIGEIAKKLKVSKGSASLWCQDVQLSTKQMEKLHQQMVRGSYSGRMKGVCIQKERKQSRINYYLKKAKNDIKKIKNRELLMAGLGLYWGEGGKKESRVRFFNSDPLVIKFIMKWFREILNVSNDRHIMRVTINISHKERLHEINEYWSKITGISIEQFKEPTLIKSKNKKRYENHSHHYGTLCVGVSRSSDLFYRIMGLITAMSEAT